MAILYYIHDPMCSWCYAFDRVLKQIQSQLPQSIKLVKILGGLAPDSKEPMPGSLVNTLKMNWKKIEETVSHIQFNDDFWKNNQPLRSTYPACRAVLTATKQAPDLEDKMITQIQWAYYKNAENPSLDATLLDCAKRIGLNEKTFISDYQSQWINNQLLQQIDFARGLGVASYPSLCLEIDGQNLEIQIDYNNASFIIEQIQNNIL